MSKIHKKFIGIDFIIFFIEIDCKNFFSVRIDFYQFRLNPGISVEVLFLIFNRNQSLKKNEDALKREMDSIKNENYSLKSRSEDAKRERENERTKMQKMEKELKKEEQV